MVYRQGTPEQSRDFEIRPQDDLPPDVVLTSEEDEIAVERFKREYETADMFDHPHIVKVIDFGETSDRQHYMTMEYLEGLELGELVRRHGAQRLPPSGM